MLRFALLVLLCVSQVQLQYYGYGRGEHPIYRQHEFPRYHEPHHGFYPRDRHYPRHGYHSRVRRALVEDNPGLSLPSLTEVDRGLIMHQQSVEPMLQQFDLHQYLMNYMQRDIMKHQQPSNHIQRELYVPGGMPPYAPSGIYK